MHPCRAADVMRIFEGGFWTFGFAIENGISFVRVQYTSPSPCKVPRVFTLRFPHEKTDAEKKYVFMISNCPRCTQTQRSTMR